MFSSDACSRPRDMNLRVNSSSSRFFDGTSHSTIFTYTFVSQIMTITFTILNVVWKIDRPNDTLICISPTWRITS